MKIGQRILYDLGLKREVLDSLPYAVVGGAFDGSFTTALGAGPFTLLNHVVPAGKQLKLLYINLHSNSANGIRSSILQTNPTALGQTGAVEAYPVVGAVPSGVRDYPTLTASGSQALVEGLRSPIHVLEGSIAFRIHGPIAVSGSRYGLTWWGVEEEME
jgi:hypothetical protein